MALTVCAMVGTQSCTDGHSISFVASKLCSSNAQATLKPRMASLLGIQGEMKREVWVFNRISR